MPQTQNAQPATTVHTIATPVGRQGWADEVGQHILWTAKSDSSRADLVLNPPELGRIEVSIHMNGDQANASFMAANPAAREALQDAMPRLRELMSQAGVQLGQADVSAGQSGQSNAQDGRRQTGGGNVSGMLGSVGAVGSTWWSSSMRATARDSSILSPDIFRKPRQRTLTAKARTGKGVIKTTINAASFFSTLHLPPALSVIQGLTERFETRQYP